MDIIEFELIAEEIVCMMVGSIGLILSAPLATGLAVWFMQHNKNSTKVGYTPSVNNKL